MGLFQGILDRFVGARLRAEEERRAREAAKASLYRHRK